MSTLAERLKEALQEAGISKSDLARACDISPSSVTQWLQDDGTKSLEGKNLLNAARALNVSPDWLANEKGPKRVAETTSGPDVKGKVPIISWVQAGAFMEAVDNFEPGQADEWTDTSVPIHRHTYALRVNGDSMTNPGGAEPTFPHGQIIVVEPDAIDSPDKLVGSFVIVRRDGDDEATFKKLVRDGGRFLLRPLNPQYPLIELKEGDVFCGVVREKVVRFF